MTQQAKATVGFLDQGTSNVARTLRQHEYDPNALRPYLGRDGRAYIDRVGNDGKLHAVRVGNDNEAVLPYEAWRRIDRAVVETARPELRIVSDLNSAPGVPDTVNAMRTTMVSYQTKLADATARVTMRPTTRSDRNRPEYGIRNTPLPFIISEWSFDIRDMGIAEAGGQPLDTTQIRECTRAVLETAEDMTLGVGDFATPWSYDGAPIYGLFNFPDVNTQVLTAPTAGGWEPETTYNEINQMIQKSIDDNNAGPWMLYVSSGWDYYLNFDYSATNQALTLRQKILSLEGLQGIRTIRRSTLENYKMALVQMNGSTIRLITGLPLRNYQWTSPHGFEVFGRVMTCIVPVPLSDASNQTGITIGSSA